MMFEVVTHIVVTAMANMIQDMGVPIERVPEARRLVKGILV